MTDAELYGVIVTVAMITGIVFLAVSVLLFFRLRIVKVIRDLTGRSAKYGIKKSKADVKKRKEQEQRFAKQQRAHSKGAKGTGMNSQSDRTEELGEATTVLESQDTVVLDTATNADIQETEVLRTEQLGTEQLATGTERLSKASSSSDMEIQSETADMIIEDNITVVNSDVIIP